MQELYIPSNHMPGRWCSSHGFSVSWVSMYQPIPVMSQRPTCRMYSDVTAGQSHYKPEKNQRAPRGNPGQVKCIWGSEAIRTTALCQLGNVGRGVGPSGETTSSLSHIWSPHSAHHPLVSTGKPPRRTCGRRSEGRPTRDSFSNVSFI
ncbi:hypothetical protein UPYG_G00251360 [Umbra pygmaea]|uniref:Uncharacterized protein n=1 Tax=Umbra pygmaea TaxID=75934 RepID=A0ABD0WC12_UMBPY